MRPVFLCDAVRTPIGRYGGALAQVRTDDLAAIPTPELTDTWRPVPHADVVDVLTERAGARRLLLEQRLWRRADGRRGKPVP